MVEPFVLNVKRNTELAKTLYSGRLVARVTTYEVAHSSVYNAFFPNDPMKGKANRARKIIIGCHSRADARHVGVDEGSTPELRRAQG